MVTETPPAPATPDRLLAVRDAYDARTATERARRELEEHRERADDEQALFDAAAELPHLEAIAAAEAAQAIAEQTAGGRVYRVRVENLPKLITQVAKVARRAAKLDLDPVTLTEALTETVRHDHGRTVQVTEYRYIIISGPAPRLAGWGFVAVLDHDSDGAGHQSTVIRRVPQWAAEYPDVDLTAYRDAPPRCEHCDTIRQRASTYVVAHENGEIRQVGSSCLRDFTGHGSADRFATFAESYSTLDELADDAERDLGCGGGPPTLLDTDAYLTFVAYDVRVNGWTSRSQSPFDATADRALNHYDAALRGRATTLPDDDDAATALRVLAWVRDDLACRDGLSEYEYNLTVVCDADAIPPRRAGIAASVIAAEARERDRRIRREREAIEDPGHLGELGERVEVGVTVENVRTTENAYGTTTIYKLRADSGHLLTWFASRDPLDLEGSYVLKGTVKKHADWQGLSETHLTRCKVIRERAIDATDDGS